MTKRFPYVRHLPTIYIPLIILIILNIWMNPNMLSPRGINNLSMQVLPVILAVMAQTIALIVKELDVSVGAMIGLSTVILATTMDKLGFVSIILVILIAFIIGGINGALISYFHVPGIVVTLASSMVIGGIALMIMSEPGGIVPISFNSIFTENYLFIPNSLIILLVLLLLWKYFKNMRIGQSIYATGGNYFSAFATGISVHKAKIIAFGLSAVLASIAGMVLTAKTMSGDATIGDPYTLNSIAGAILGGASFFGGVGTMKGAVGGAIVISILVNILFFLGISTFYQYIVNGLILIIAFLFSISRNSKENGG